MKLNNDRDEFEQFLKASTESFKMQPNIKVWNSIYNNIHPGKKWPAFSTILLMAISLLFIDKYNNFQMISTKPPIKKINYSKKETYNDIKSHVNLNSPSYLENINSRNSFSQHHKRKNNTKVKRADLFLIDSIQNSATLVSNNSDILAIEQKFLTLNSLNNQLTNLDAIRNMILPLKEINKNKSDAEKEINIVRKNNNKYSYEIYVVPSCGYRVLNKFNAANKLPASFYAQSSAYNESYSFNHSPNWNFEVGGALMINVSKSVKLKTGLQLNYTDYKIYANKIGEPAYANLQTINHQNGYSTLESYTSSYFNVADGQAGNQYNSNTFQVSIPVGAEVKLLSTKNFEWLAGAAIQPSLLITGTPFLISADMKNYINDKDLYRRWNINTSFETHFSYKINNGYLFNAGPQFRYQLFSTYQSKYIYNEYLYNIGLKLGISKSF